MTSLLVLFALSAGWPQPESRADYRIRASLLPDSSLVAGQVEIDFHNGSPHSVDTLWLHLYPNAYRDRSSAFARDLEARGRYDFSTSSEEDRGWIRLEDLRVNGVSASPLVDGTLCAVPIPQTLAPGDSIRVSAGFRVKVPRFWSRMGRNDHHFTITQWYPKMCALDSEGWHRSRYHLEGEFYSDFGSYRVELAVPEEYVVAATGTPDSNFSNPDSSLRTEVWTAQNVHDFAWVADPDFQASYHTFVYPDSLGGDSVEVAVFRGEDGDGYWKEVEEVADSTLLYYGQWYAPYPYHRLTIVDDSRGAPGGMEYPTLVVIGAMDIPMTRLLEVVVSHEIGHQWFYGMLGNDEVDEAWLDEGMNTFSELRYMDRRYGRWCNLTTVPPWLACVSDHALHSMGYVQLAGRERVPVLSRATDAADGSHPSAGTYYSKPTLFLRMVRLSAGAEPFDRAMREYFRRFAFHHPHSGDFQAILEETTGRAWTEEFDYWLRGTGSMDLGVAAVDCRGDSTRVRLHGFIPHDLKAELLLAGDGGELLDTLLLRSADTTVAYAGSWSSAEVDPNTSLPDSAPWNNALPAKGALRPLLLPMPEPSRFNSWVLPIYMPSCVGGGLGVALLSYPLPVAMGGPWNLGAYATAPLEHDGCPSFGGALMMKLASDHRRKLAWTTTLSSRYGLESVRSGLTLRRRGITPADPAMKLSVALGVSAVSDTSHYGGARTERGAGLEARLGAGVEWSSYPMSGELSASALLSPGWNRGSYGRIGLSAALSARLRRRLAATTSLYAGRAWGDAPPQVYPALAGALSSNGHIFRRGGCGLAGYGDSYRRDRWAVSARESLSLPPYRLLGLVSPRAYIGGTLLAGSPGGLLDARPYLAAGIELDLPLVTAYFPLWLSRPPDNDDRTAFRWAISLDFLPGN